MFSIINWTMLCYVYHFNEINTILKNTKSMDLFYGVINISGCFIKQLTCIF